MENHYTKRNFRLKYDFQRQDHVQVIKNYYQIVILDILNINYIKYYLTEQIEKRNM